ncbi:MAG: hypothetical protein ABI978_01045 [Chloroflexota bacterium]
MWSLAPVAAGFTWVQLTTERRFVAAVAVGTAVTAVATLLLWLAIAHPDCEFGAVRDPSQLVVPSLIVGLAIGAGVAIGGLPTTAIVGNRHRWWAVVGGAASAWGALFLAILPALIVLSGPGCNRPPV